MSNSSRAVILLSTYNGEKYIESQINSILLQTHENFLLYIRDDGSTDNTVSIIEEFQTKEPRIFFIKDDKNLGYPACFYQLTDIAPKADYYFFADQDDFWMPDKIERAISVIENSNKKGPIAYYSNYHICDENLNIVGHSSFSGKKITLCNSLFQVAGLEFTMAINYEALILLNNNKPSYCSGRGTWMSMLYAAFGNIILDDYYCAFYRRHSSAVTSSSQSGFGLFMWRISNFFKNNGFADYREILDDFNKVCGAKLDRKNRRMVFNFSRQKYFPYVITKLFYPKRLRDKLIDELALRFVFMLGKL